MSAHKDKTQTKVLDRKKNPIEEVNDFLDHINMKKSLRQDYTKFILKYPYKARHYFMKLILKYRKDEE